MWVHESRRSSSAVVAAIGTGAGFKQGRDFGAWLGLVPKQESTGDRTILGKISKRGNMVLLRFCGERFGVYPASLSN